MTRDVVKYIRRIPDPDSIRARITRNARENAALRRLLRVAVDAHHLDIAAGPARGDARDA